MARRSAGMFMRKVALGSRGSGEGEEEGSEERGGRVK